MPEVTDQQLKFRKYLLGQTAAGPSREEIEVRLLTDEQYFEELLAAEDELIEDYVDERLASDDRAAFENHFLISAERRETLNFVRALRTQAAAQHTPLTSQEASPAAARVKPKRDFKSYFVPLRRRSLPLAFASLALIGGIGLLVWNFYFRASETQIALLALNRAYRHERPLESRITEFDYAPYNKARGSGEPDKTDLTERNRAERILLDQAADAPDAVNLSALGRLYLAKGEFDNSISQFERAARLAPGNSAAISDLGAAYLEKSRTLAADGSGEKLMLTSRALENFEKALQLDPSLLPARFNKALCLQILNSPHEAEKAWQDYLARDPRSSWAGDAAQHLRELQSNKPQSRTRDALLHDFFAAFDRKDDAEAYRLLSRNREMITGKLLPQQLAGLFLKAAGAEKSRHLAALKYAGELESQKSGDPFFTRLADFYAALFAGCKNQRSASGPGRH